MGEWFTLIHRDIKPGDIMLTMPVAHRDRRERSMMEEAGQRSGDARMKAAVYSWVSHTSRLEAV